MTGTRMETHDRSENGRSCMGRFVRHHPVTVTYSKQTDNESYPKPVESTPYLSFLISASGRAIAQAVHRRSLNTEVLVQARVNPFRRRSVQSTHGTHCDRFFSESFGFTLLMSFHCCSIYTEVLSG
jgi:hypothetical protein